MYLDLKNKIVVITGGTRGIGAAIAKVFNDSGAYVLVSGTDKAEDNKLENFSNRDNIQYHQLDFSSDKSLDQFLVAIKELKKVDILINNAGVNKIDTITEIAVDDWDWINTVNMRGPFLLTQAVSENMKKQRCGKIINIASVFSVVSKEKRSAYSSTKWGLIGFTKAVALDLAPFNILVNAVSPGFVDTDLTRHILGYENMNRLSKSIPQGRLANPDEIAKVVLFLCSDQNTYITGQNVIIDGGFTSA